MQKFTTLTGIAAYLPMINVDTDMIIPKQYLKTIKRTGLGRGLFAELRYDEKGAALPTSCCTSRLTRGADPDHRREFRLRVVPRARALGPARFRHQVHHRAVLRRHLLQQLLQERHSAHHAAASRDRQADRRRLARGERAASPSTLPAQEIRGPDGGVIKFDIDPFRKRCLMEGLDDIGLTMEKADAIADFEAKSRTARPWA